MSKSKVRQYIIQEMQATGSNEDFEVAEALLVMYDSGIVNAVEEEGSDPKFVLNEEATDKQKQYAERVHEALHNAPNDVWNLYVHGRAC